MSARPYKLDDIDREWAGPGWDLKPWKRPWNSVQVVILLQTALLVIGVTIIALLSLLLRHLKLAGPLLAGAPIQLDGPQTIPDATLLLVVLIVFGIALWGVLRAAWQNFRKQL